MFSFLMKPKALTSGKQLKELRKMGIFPRPGLTPREYLKFREEAYVEKPYLLVLIALGGTTHSLDPVSDRIWHLHLECIQANGDYAKAALRLRDLSDGGLPITDIKDRIDFEEGVAWLEFDLDGQRHHWDISLRDRWLDKTLLTRFAELQVSRGSGKRFTFLKLGGHDGLIGCCTEAERLRLNAKTGLSFQWLE